MHIFDGEFCKSGGEFWLHGNPVEHPEEISSAMGKTLKADRPVVIELITDPNCKAPITRD